METILLTEEQARAIEYARVYSKTDEHLVEEFVKYKLRNDRWGAEELKPLNELKTKDLIRALYVGYNEVKTANKGDIVKITYPNKEYIIRESNLDNTPLTNGLSLICRRENREDLKEG